MNLQGMGNVVNCPWPVTRCDVADGRVTRCLKDWSANWTYRKLLYTSHLRVIDPYIVILRRTILSLNLSNQILSNIDGAFVVTVVNAELTLSS